MNDLYFYSLKDINGKIITTSNSMFSIELELMIHGNGKKDMSTRQISNDENEIIFNCWNGEKFTCTEKRV